MRLSVGVGVGPFRVSQTLARSGRRGPSTRQALATDAAKLVGQAAAFPVATAAKSARKGGEVYEQLRSGERSWVNALAALVIGPSLCRPDK